MLKKKSSINYSITACIMCRRVCHGDHILVHMQRPFAHLCDDCLGISSLQPFVCDWIT